MAKMLMHRIVEALRMSRGDVARYTTAAKVLPDPHYVMFRVEFFHVSHQQHVTPVLATSPIEHASTGAGRAKVAGTVYSRFRRYRRGVTNLNLIRVRVRWTGTSEEMLNIVFKRKP